MDSLLLPAADPSAALQILPFPSTDPAKQQLLEHLHSASSTTTPTTYRVANLSHAHIYAIPPPHCDRHTQLEYISLCIQVVPVHPSVSKTDLLLRGLETKLELLLMPTHHVQATSQLLTKFEQEVSSVLILRII